MNEQNSFEFEDVWEVLLSRQPERVRKVFARLDENERRVVRAHLLRMTTEPGWHPEQVISAQAALDALSTV